MRPPPLGSNENSYSPVLSVVPGLCVMGEVSEERCNSQKLSLSSLCADIRATLEVRTPRRTAIPCQVT